MRVAIVGQQQFGKAVLDAFMHRGDSVAGVFCAPDKPGAAVDQLKTAALAAAVPVFQFASLRGADARDALRNLAVDLGIMAYVLQFAPEDFTSIPRHGTIQYHPSLLPRHRGPSSINWPIILGESTTGLSIFRPTEGLDEGPLLLQKSIAIGPDDTLGQVYFDRLFPLGVAALLEAADLVAQGLATPLHQDPAAATYEGWCRDDEAHVDWHRHADQIYDLIRGCDPAPGAWTWLQGKKLQLFDARKLPTRGFSKSAGGPGTVVGPSDRGFLIAAHGGQIDVGRVRHDGTKMPAGQFYVQQGLTAGTRLG